MQLEAITNIFKKINDLLFFKFPFNGHMWSASLVKINLQAKCTA